MKEITSNSAIGIGISLGVALGAAFDNVGVGIAIGVALGAAWAAQIDAKNKIDADDK